MAYEALQEEGRAGVSNGNGMKLRIDTARVQSDLAVSCIDAKECLRASAVPVAIVVVIFSIDCLFGLFIWGICDLGSDGLTLRNIVFICLLPSIIVIVCICYICYYAIMHNWVVCEADPPQPD